VSIFGNIMSKIWGHSGSAAPSNMTTGSAQAPSQGSAGAAPSAQTSDGAVSGSASTSASSPASSAKTSVDVTSVLDGLAAKNQQKLDWRHSIVDMMKLLDLDSSLTARKELATELHYTGDTSDSASMNIWLHKQVMQKLAENGGRVPDELKH
jgi:uncharacterized protein DUF3597